jgi:hypothetical protein
LQALVAAGATPTMTSLRATFMRLYWDRVLALAVASVAGTSALVGGPGQEVAIGAGAVLFASIALRSNRYRGRVPRALEVNAARITETTGARAVVFGHIHAPVSHGVYRNTGSFAFPGAAPGRPYVCVDDEDCVAHHIFHRGVARAA